MTIDAVATLNAVQLPAALDASAPLATGRAGIDVGASDFADALSEAMGTLGAPNQSGSLGTTGVQGGAGSLGGSGALGGTLFDDALAAGAGSTAGRTSGDGFVQSGIGTGGGGTASEIISLLAEVITDLEGGTGLGGSAGLSTTSGLISMAGGNQAGATGGPTGSNVVTEAERFEGTPYVWGGTSPSGFDCSGLVQYVYGQLGIELPRTSEEQAQVGTPVASLADARPGDLVFFAGSDGTASAPGHVGIYIGNGEMVDAPHTGTSVQVQTVPASDVVAIRRIVPDGAAASTGAILTSDAVPDSSGTGTVMVGNVPVPSSYAGTIEQAASANGIPATLLSALLYHESRFEPGAVSSAGAEGIAQFMPATAAGMGIDPLDPTQAINGAAQLLGSYSRQFGSYADALAAYDAGSSAVLSLAGLSESAGPATAAQAVVA